MATFKERLQTVLELLGPMRLQYAMLYVLAGISAALEVVSVGLMLPLVEAVTQEASTVPLPNFVEWVVTYLTSFSLLQLAGILLVVFAAKGVLKLFAQYGNSKIVEEMRGAWMAALFDKYTRQHYLFFVSSKHGELMYNMFDLCQRAMFGLRQPVGFFLHGFALVLTLVLLASISWQFTVASLVLLGGGYAVIHRPMLRKSSKLGKAVLGSYHETSALASEVLRGIREVKAYGAAANLVQQYRAAVRRMVKRSVKIAFLEVTPTVVPEILLALLFFMAIAVLNQRYAAGGIETLMPILGTFSYGLYRVFVQGSTVVRTAIAFSSHWASIDRLAQELGDIKHVDASEGTESIVRKANKLTCEHVSFAYEDHRALDDISLEFKHGTITAIVGDSGAGKSTLADIFIRLLEPTSGTIRYGASSISDYTLAAWRHAVALVSQDVFLFHGTIRENLILGLAQDVSDERIREALHLAGAEEFVRNLPDGWDTMVGERGVKLSGGQRQRIAIARALVRRPHVLLLDEATSALDVRTEAALLQTLQSLKRGLMIIAITHRPAVARQADLVYVLRSGKVVESGTHEELARRGGEYRNFYEHVESHAA